MSLRRIGLALASLVLSLDGGLAGSSSCGQGQSPECGDPESTSLLQAQWVGKGSKKDKGTSTGGKGTSAKSAKCAEKLKESAIVVIDMQNDFAHPNGTLSAAGANKDVVKPINKLLGLKWGLRVFTADNHPHNHVSFATNYPSYRPDVPNGAFPIIELSYTAFTKASGAKICGAEHVERYGEAGAVCNSFPTAKGEVNSPEIFVPQETYPPHCIQGTWGQKIVDGLTFSYNDPDDHLVLKGQNAHIDSYSAVFNNVACNGTATIDSDSGEPNSLTCIPTQEPYPQETSLPDLLRISGVKHVYFVGLCQDYCVKYSSIHTAFLGSARGWDTYVIEDATRACSPSEFHTSQSLQQMQDSGVKIVKMSDVMP